MFWITGVVIAFILGYVTVLRDIEFEDDYMKLMGLGVLMVISMAFSWSMIVLLALWLNRDAILKLFK